MTDLSQASEFLLARWVLPVSSEPVENACLVISEDKILAVLSRNDYEKLPDKLKRKSSRDYGEAVIVPGLSNLHTHLDYSRLKHFDNYSAFFSWIRSLIAKSWQWSPQEWLESALGGAREIMLSGSSLIVDASYSGAAARAVAISGLRGIVGLEIFGIDESKAGEAFSDWLCKYEKFKEESGPEVKEAIASGRLKVTIAPHTPYSVSPELIRKCLDWSRAQKLPLLIHISESEAECRWIAAGDEDLDKFLTEAFRGEIPDLSWRGHGLSPVAHLNKHGLLADNVLAAHLVQATESDIEMLQKKNVAGVHCPRSNSRLRNGIAPFSKFIKAGMRMGLGTDSSASTDDLDILQEARFAWDLHRAVDKSFNMKASEALYYLTLGAAQAVGLADLCGSLESGKKADIAVFSLANLPEFARKHPADSLIYGGTLLLDLLVDGKRLVTNGYIAGNES